MRNSQSKGSAHFVRGSGTPDPPKQSRERSERRFCGKVTALFLSLACAALHAEQPLPPQLQGVGIEEKLGAHIDLGLTFTAENGYPAALREFFHKDRPVILDLAYYECPMLCTLVLNGQTEAMRELPGAAGKDFEVVTISINPAEGFDLAQKKRRAYLESYGRTAGGWHFLTDRDGNAKKLAEQIGFHYRWDEQSRQFAHPAAIMVLTPEGKVSRYLYGIRFKPRDLRLALAEAVEERFTLSADRVLLYCFHYDPQAGSYVPFAANIMRAGGALFVLGLAVVLLRMWRRERRPHPRPETA